jgi:hypothetical protein
MEVLVAIGSVACMAAAVLGLAVWAGTQKPEDLVKAKIRAMRGIQMRNAGTAGPYADV